MFTKSSRFYDAQYHWKHYDTEAARLAAIIREYVPKAKTLLNVACGTGLHDEHLLKAGFTVTGLDLDPGMLTIARERCPNIVFHEGDMAAFGLGTQFDAVVCLFSSIGYCGSVGGLLKTMTCLATHTTPGGVVVVEPWLTPETYRLGTTHALFVDLPDIKLARMNVSLAEDRLSIMDLHFLVAEGGDISSFTERHELYMFTDDEYRSAFASAGLKVSVDAEGLMGRGLYVGVKA